MLVEAMQILDQEAKRGQCGTLVLEDGTSFEGTAFGSARAQAGEVVFSTSMVGYPEAMTDASYTGQILVMTYPLIGNYGVPEQALWEADRIHIAGLVVSDAIDTPSHWQSTLTLQRWLKLQDVPALQIKDTRALVQHLRRNGTMLGKIVYEHDVPFHDPHRENLVARVSVKQPVDEGEGTKTILLLDCGAKRNIARCLLKRSLRVITVPWDYNPFTTAPDLHFDGIVISNGPGNPKMAAATIETIKTALQHNIPTLGICLGNQLLALASGGDTYKLKYGHRSQNQPCLVYGTKRCYITTQNHGFAVGEIPPGFAPWFVNANDGSNEGIIHRERPFMSVQFHPEAAPGPMDTEWIFDYFLERL